MGDVTARKWFAEEYPKLLRMPVRWKEIIQEPGDILFVPSGCLHTVLALEDSISLSINAVDEYNWDRVMAEMRDKQPSLAAELEKYRNG